MSATASGRPGIARVACLRGIRVAGRSGYRRDFAANEKVRSATQVRNDGTYPHKDIGEILVCEGDVGFVHESWTFLGEVYYTVEFIERAVVVIMRAREMAKHDCKPALA
jgi:nitrogen fixation protein NifZ